MSKTESQPAAAARGGFKTAGQRARSALNNLKRPLLRHGSLLKYECDRVFLDTYRHLLAAWAPANRFEANLVQQLAHIEWSLFRCRALETSLLESAFNRQDNSFSGLPQPLDPAIAASDLPSSIALHTLNIYRKLPSEPSQPIHSKQRDFGSNPNSNPTRTPSEPLSNPERTPSEPHSDPIRTTPDTPSNS
ncbi:MAG: hypothetical protein HS123_02675 [Solibacteraceae bacterium]|nr:hypothetical protein [Solibacteraceae bacterium]